MSRRHLQHTLAKGFVSIPESSTLHLKQSDVIECEYLSLHLWRRVGFQRDNSIFYIKCASGKATTDDSEIRKGGVDYNPKELVERSD